MTKRLIARIVQGPGILLRRLGVTLHHCTDLYTASSSHRFPSLCCSLTSRTLSAVTPDAHHTHRESYATKTRSYELPQLPVARRLLYLLAVHLGEIDLGTNLLASERLAVRG